MLTVWSRLILILCHIAFLTNFSPLRR